MIRYRTDPARTGLALALGGSCIGLATVGLGWAGGSNVGGLVAWWLSGTVMGMMTIAALGGPGWWLSQRLGGRRRGPVAAGVTGAAVAALATLAALTRGFGLGLPLADTATLAATWSSALAMAVVAGFLGAWVALAMWLVGYRPD